MKPLTHKRLIEKELHGFGIRLNKKPPAITVTKRDKGGVSVALAPGVKLIGLDDTAVANICKEYKMSNCSVHFRMNATADDLIDAIEGNRHFVPALYVMNKIDQITIEELDVIDK